MTQNSENARIPWPALSVFLALAGVILALAAGGETTRAALGYERDAVFAGEWWRLASGHVVHLSAGHLWLNAVGLALVAWLVASVHGAGAWCFALSASAITISISLLMFHTEIQWYVGLSGVLHGLLAAGVVPGARRRDRDSLILLVLLTGKLAWEALVGPLPGSETSAGGPVLTEAHLYGTFGGLGAGLILDWRERRRRPV